MITLLSTLFLFFSSTWLVKKILSRIGDLDKAIKNIHSHAVQTRLNLEEWPIELKSLGKNFNNMLNRIESAFARLAQFSADIAHELRNPINSLSGMTEVALMKKTLLSGENY